MPHIFLSREAEKQLLEGPETRPAARHRGTQSRGDDHHDHHHDDDGHDDYDDYDDVPDTYPAARYHGT